jgi:hypothetical protein
LVSRSLDVHYIQIQAWKSVRETGFPNRKTLAAVVYEPGADVNRIVPEFAGGLAGLLARDRQLQPGGAGTRAA